MTKGLFITSILAVALLMGATAWSDDSSLQKAKELNQEAYRLYQQGRYVEVVVESRQRKVRIRLKAKRTSIFYRIGLSHL